MDFEANVESFNDMTNISLELRKKLEEEFTLNIFKIISIFYFIVLSKFDSYNFIL